MPYLKVQTSAAVKGAANASVLKRASQLLAQQRAKPEDYVMVSLELNRQMFFAGSAEPAAFLELRAIGLPVEKTGDLSRLLCELIHTELGVAKDRIFINFADVSPSLWGWNGGTF